MGFNLTHHLRDEEREATRKGDLPRAPWPTCKLSYNPPGPDSCSILRAPHYAQQTWQGCPRETQITLGPRLP